jgi:hypothetical protein
MEWHDLHMNTYQDSFFVRKGHVFVMLLVVDSDLPFSDRLSASLLNTVLDRLPS